jgi:hypothetical protein
MTKRAQNLLSYDLRGSGGGDCDWNVGSSYSEPPLDD